MKLVVHQPFALNGRDVKRGDVLTGTEAASVMADPVQRNFVCPVAGSKFPHIPDITSAEASA